MKPITLQDAFNAAWQAFIVERKPPSEEWNGMGYDCRYRGEKGRRCAIGLLIPDEMYKPEMEVGPVSVLVKLFPELKFEGNLQDFDELQHQLHDALCVRGEWRPIEDRIAAYEDFAERYNLEIPS